MHTRKASWRKDCPARQEVSEYYLLVVLTTLGISFNFILCHSTAAVGRLVFTPKQAEDMKAKGESVILARETTSPEDVGGMWAAAGILTARG